MDTENEGNQISIWGTWINVFKEGGRFYVAGKYLREKLKQKRYNNQNICCFLSLSGP